MLLFILKYFICHMFASYDDLELQNYLFYKSFDKLDEK